MRRGFGILQALAIMLLLAGLLTIMLKYARIGVRHTAESYLREQTELFLQSSIEQALLEISDSDAVQVARAGQALEVPVDENPEIIEINWSHTFAIRDRKFFLTSYSDSSESELMGAPTQQINAAVRRILKRYSPELLDQVHVRGDTTDAP